jgi:hypothetical protein
MGQRVLVPIGVNRPWRDRWTEGWWDGQLDGFRGSFISHPNVLYNIWWFHSIPFTPPTMLLCFLKRIHSLLCISLAGICELSEWNCRHELKHAANRFLAETKWQTHSGFQSLLEVATTYSVTSIICTYLIIKSSQKQKVGLWLAVCNKCVLQFSRKAFAQFWFRWVLIHTHREACQLCTGSSQHKEGNIYIYIYIYIYISLERDIIKKFTFLWIDSLMEN